MGRTVGMAKRPGSRQMEVQPSAISGLYRFPAARGRKGRSLWRENIQRPVTYKWGLFIIHGRANITQIGRWGRSPRGVGGVDLRLAYSCEVPQMAPPRQVIPKA